MKALLMMIRQIPHGWAVQLTDGRELARFRGPGSRVRALRYMARATKAAGSVAPKRPLTGGAY